MKENIIPYKKETLQKIYNDSYSYAEVLRKTNRSLSGGNRELLKKKIEEFSIDVSHFKGSRWRLGETKDTDERLARQAENQRMYTIEQALCKDSPLHKNSIRSYIYRHKIIEYKCLFCGCDGSWLDTIISLELDHIDGDTSNNELLNLRWLCPNCHATTDTFRSKNNKTF